MIELTYNPKVQYIPALPPQRETRVGIYSRVSSNSMDQLNSLTSQVSALTRMVASVPRWLLVDAYIDIASSKTGSSRKEFNRMLEDCKSKNLEIIITKNISRFGRDTVEVLEALHQLRLLGIRVIFEQENLDTADTDNDLMISIIESIAQAENESRSDNIKWGIKQKAAQGTSKLYNRKCYGYENDADGELIIKEEEAKNVKLIFDLYLQGKSKETINRINLDFISEDDDNAMFNPGDNIEVNASKFINELSPYSLINTTDLFTDKASETINKKYNIFGIDN